MMILSDTRYIFFKNFVNRHGPVCIDKLEETHRPGQYRIDPTPLDDSDFDRIEHHIKKNTTSRFMSMVTRAVRDDPDRPMFYGCMLGVPELHLPTRPYKISRAKDEADMISRAYKRHLMAKQPKSYQDACDRWNATRRNYANCLVSESEFVAAKKAFEQAKIDFGYTGS